MRKPSQRSSKKPAARKARPVMSRRDMRLLEGAALGVFVVLIVGAFAITSIGGFIVHTNQEAAVEVAVLVDLTNQNRVEDDLQGLTVSPLLTEAAQEKADDEASKGYFAHTSPQGLDSWYWFKQVGYNFTYAGENLAVNFTDSDAVMSAWMNSPEHRANILDSHYTQIGIATASGMYEGEPTIFVVQEFGTPAPATTASAITQQTQPAEPTQIAQASAQPVAQATSSAPQVLGDTTKTPPRVAAAKPNAPAAIASTQTASATSTRLAAIAALSPLSPTAGTTARYASAWDFYLASPQTTLRYAYYAIGMLVLFALLFTTGLEFKRHHLRQVAIAGGLLVIMCGLFFVSDDVFFGPPVVAQAPIISSA